MGNMLGKCGKPFCGDCCSAYPQGSGKANKRISKRIAKRKEAERVRKDENL